MSRIGGVFLRKLSTIIYFIHPIIIWFVGVEVGVKLFTLTATISIMLSIIIVALSKKIKILNHLF